MYIRPSGTNAYPVPPPPFYSQGLAVDHELPTPRKALPNARFFNQCFCLHPAFYSMYIRRSGSNAYIPCFRAPPFCLGPRGRSRAAHAAQSVARRALLLRVDHWPRVGRRTAHRGGQLRRRTLLSHGTYLCLYIDRV